MYAPCTVVYKPVLYSLNVTWMLCTNVKLQDEFVSGTFEGTFNWFLEYGFLDC